MLTVLEFQKAFGFTFFHYWNGSHGNVTQVLHKSIVNSQQLLSLKNCVSLKRFIKRESS